MDNGSKSKKKVDWEKVRHGLKVAVKMLVIATTGPIKSASDNSSKD